MVFLSHPSVVACGCSTLQPTCCSDCRSQANPLMRSREPGCDFAIASIVDATRTGSRPWIITLSQLNYVDIQDKKSKSKANPCL